MSPPVVTQFGKYVLHERIAAGGMAEVFKGSLAGDAGFERAVAIKRILPHLGEDREFVTMFVDEAKIAVQVSHANIVQILDLGCHDGAYFIAMEYVHGKDLRSILERARSRGGAVPSALACHAAMKVAEGLHHAHRATGRDGRPLGLIHRDVSPQNVLVSFEGEVKVVDFGLAKAAGRATQTQAGVLKGKLAYLSPQQAAGDDIDQRSDVYSLGLVLFELLTGRRMFDRRNDVETVLAVQAGEVIPLRQVAPEMPAHLDAILRRALERDVALRYQTAMDLHDDLEVFVYESGEQWSRRDVSQYMRNLFEEEAPPEVTVATAIAPMATAPTRTTAAALGWRPGDTIPAPPPDDAAEGDDVDGEHDDLRHPIEETVESDPEERGERDTYTDELRPSGEGDEDEMEEALGAGDPTRVVPSGPQG